MGEHHSNAKAIIKDELGIGKAEDKSVSPINVVSLMLITELARIGHTYLKTACPDMKANIDAGKSEITQEQYEHFKALYDSGFDVLAHFDAMCQYLHDEIAKKEKTEKSDADKLAEHDKKCHGECAAADPEKCRCHDDD